MEIFMSMFNVSPQTFYVLEFLSILFIFIIGAVALVFICFFIIDVIQTKDAIRHNYPVIGRLRYLFLKLGDFFRQYFFSMDREEMPFNRAERNWVYNASNNEDTMLGFG